MWKEGFRQLRSCSAQAWWPRRVGAAELDVSGRVELLGRGQGRPPWRPLSIIRWRGSEVREYKDLREPSRPTGLGAVKGWGLLAGYLGGAADTGARKDSSLAPLHPKGTSRIKLPTGSSTPPREVCLPGEVHERLPLSGSLEGCTSGCAKLASRLFPHFRRQPGPGNCSPCL